MSRQKYISLKKQYLEIIRYSFQLGGMNSNKNANNEIENKDYDIKIFIDAQKIEYKTALKEIKAGEKTTHWIWYIFPQIKMNIPNTSEMSKKYAIQSLGHARQYLDNQYLLNNMIKINVELGKHLDKRLDCVMGSCIDAIKYISSATLFAFAACRLHKKLYKVLINNLKLIKNNVNNKKIVTPINSLNTFKFDFNSGVDMNTITELVSQNTYKLSSIQKKILDDLQSI